MRSNKPLNDRFVLTQQIDHETNEKFTENIIYKLKIFIGESTLTYELKTGRYLVGRVDNCDIEIIDQSVSRRHAMIEVTPDGLALIHDLESSNKTVKNGSELRPNVVYDLADGSALKFGLVNAEFSIDNDLPSLEFTDNVSQHTHDDLFDDESMTESILDDYNNNDLNEESNEIDESIKENVDDVKTDHSQSFLEYDEFVSKRIDSNSSIANDNRDFCLTSTPAKKPLQNRSINVAESSRDSLTAALADTVLLVDQSDRSMENKTLSIKRQSIFNGVSSEIEENPEKNIEKTDKNENKIDIEESITQRICENLTGRSSESFESDFYEERTQFIPIIDDNNDDDRAVFVPTQIVTEGTVVDLEPDLSELATQPLQSTQSIVAVDQPQLSIVIDRLENSVDIDREMNQSTNKRKRGRPRKLKNSIISPTKSIVNDERETKDKSEKKSTEIGESSKKNQNSITEKEDETKRKPEQITEKKKQMKISQSGDSNKSIKNKKSIESEKSIKIENNKLLEKDKSTKIEMENDKSRKNTKPTKKKSSIKNKKSTESEQLIKDDNKKSQESINESTIINKLTEKESSIKNKASIESETTIKIESNKLMKNKKSLEKKNIVEIKSKKSIEKESTIKNKKDNLIEIESINPIKIENNKSRGNRKSLEKEELKEIGNEISLEVDKLIPNNKSTERKSSIINSKFVESEETIDIRNKKSARNKKSVERKSSIINSKFVESEETIDIGNKKSARNKTSVERKSSIKTKKSIEFEDKSLIKNEKLVGVKKPRGKQGTVKNQSKSVDCRQNVTGDKSSRKRARSSRDESVNQNEIWEDRDVFESTSAKRSRLNKFERKSDQRSQAGTERQLRRRWSSRIVAFTGIPAGQQLEKTILGLGGHLVNDDTSLAMLDANQIVLVTDRLRRTVKFLCCLAKGVPIVTIDWLEKSASCNRFVDPRPYILKTKSDTCNIDLKFNLELAENYHNTVGGIMAHHKCIVFITDNTKPDSNQMQQIISSAGGKMLLIQDDSFYEHLEDTDSTHICITDSDLTSSKIPDLYKRLMALKQKDIEILSAEFILTMIMEQKWPEFETYRIPW